MDMEGTLDQQANSDQVQKTGALEVQVEHGRNYLLLQGPRSRMRWMDDIHFAAVGGLSH